MRQTTIPNPEIVDLIDVYLPKLEGEIIKKDKECEEGTPQFGPLGTIQDQKMKTVIKEVEGNTWDVEDLKVNMKNIVAPTFIKMCDSLVFMEEWIKDELEKFKKEINNKFTLFQTNINGQISSQNSTIQSNNLANQAANQATQQALNQQGANINSALSNIDSELKTISLNVDKINSKINNIDKKIEDLDLRVKVLET